MTKLTWIFLALPVLLVGGCNSGGSSSTISKESLYRQVFKPQSQDSLASKPSSAPEYTSPTGEFVEPTEEPKVVTNVEFDPDDYILVTKDENRGFYEHLDREENAKKEGYGIDAFSVLVESTPTVNKYVYILGRINYSDGPLAFFPGQPGSNLPSGPTTYTGKIEYYDPQNDPNLDKLYDNGKFVLTRNFLDAKGKNSIKLYWNGDESDVLTADVEFPAKQDVHDILPYRDFFFSDSDLDLHGHGTIHNEFSQVYGLFKSTNYAGGFKGNCSESCPVPRTE